VDGLKGFPEAIESIFPKTEVQLCVIHQIRNSLKYIGSKDQKAFMADLKRVYRATNKDLAFSELDRLEEIWGEKYPIVIRSWRNNWDRLSWYFKYSEAIRRIIYTTNTIEAVHRQFRKLTKTLCELQFNSQVRGVSQPRQPIKTLVFGHSECQ